MRICASQFPAIARATVSLILPALDAPPVSTERTFSRTVH